MKPRNIFLAVAAAGVLVAVRLAWWSSPAQIGFWHQPPRPAPPVTETGQVIPATQPNGGVTPPPGARLATAAVAPGKATPGRASGSGAQPDQPAAGVVNPTHEAAVVEVQKVRHMIADYHTLMGENPVGTNAEIMKALMGGNPHQATLGPPDGQSLNDKGELVDSWGTTYFFHQLSRDRMEIYSAGPDKVLGTADDIVVR